VVATALRTSIRFTNRLKGRTANVADHAKVRDAIEAGDATAARNAMRSLISDVLDLIDEYETAHAGTQVTPS
jgi:DNA-binding FadR family transcriptional regulator